MKTNDKTAPVSRQPDQNAISPDLMNRMRMHGMTEAFRESLAGTTAQAKAYLPALWDMRPAKEAYALSTQMPPSFSGCSR